MKTYSKLSLFYLVAIILLSITNYSNGHIYMWDRFERSTLSPWQVQSGGSGTVDLQSEDPQNDFSHQSHGETSLCIQDTNNSSYANAKCLFPRLTSSESEFMVEFYFYVNTNNAVFSNLSIYKATDRADQRANISIYLQGSFDSINRRYWRLKISDSLGHHYMPYKETLKYWYKFQIHQLVSGRINLWINGDSVGTYVSLSSTTRPDWITIGTLNGTQNGVAYWDDFIVTTPPRNAQHPRIYFNSSQIQELRNRRTNDNITPIGVSYKTLWDRRRSWVNQWKYTPITDWCNTQYPLVWPYNQPPTESLINGEKKVVNWNTIGGRWQRRLELIAFVAKIDSNNSPNLIDTLRPCLKAITKWQQWVNPAETIRFTWTPILPFEYLNHSTAFITEGVSIIYDLIFDRLTNYERMSMQNSILALGVGQIYRGLQKGLSLGQGLYWGNWGCLYSSSMGIACLALDDTITLPNFLNFISNDFIPTLLSSTGPQPFFDPLGTNDEGLSYGTFSCQSLVRLAEAKKNVCGDFALYQNPFIQQYINGFVHLLISGWSNVVNFSDIETWAGLKVIMGDVFYILTNQYQSGLGQWLLSKMVTYDTVQADDWWYGWPISYLPQFINLKSDLQMTNPKDILGLTRNFSQIGWISARTNWLDSALVIAFKCGPVTSGHGNHQDNNNFIIGRNNQWFITDRGYHLNDVSYFHNVLTVDGQKQNWSPSSRITAFDNCGIDTSFIFFEGDASPSYSEIYNNYPLLKKWQRNGVLIRSPIPYIVLYDDIKSDTSRNLDWRLRPSDVGAYGGDSIYITGSDKNLLVKFLLPEAPQIEWDINQYPCDNIDYSLNSYFCSCDSVSRDSQQAYVYNVAPNLMDTSVTEAKYLTVFYPCNSTVNRPLMTKIDASTMVGAQVKNSVVMFSKIDTTVGDVEFQVADNDIDTASILLVHLFPSTLYKIIAKNENDTVIYFDSIMSSNQGTLCFKVQMDGSISLRVSMNIRIADENATFPNQGKHIARTINTQDYFLVYQDCNGNVFWQKRNETVNEPVILDQGKYPSIAVTAGGSSWVCYSSEVENVQYLKCRINRSEDLYDWKEFPKIWGAESTFAPSLALAIGREATPENMGYVVYATKENDKSHIYFSAFDTLQEHEEPYYTTVLDSCEGDESVLAPSISITPGDLIHIVWQKTEHGGDISRIYYITTIEPITSDDIRQGLEPRWSDIVQISRPDNPCTEPASNPSVEAYGDSVYAVWRGPYDEENQIGEIWQRIRNVNWHPEEWESPRNMSETENNESNYPVTSTNFVTVWQEQVDENCWDIYAKFEPEQSAQPIFQTPNPSKYPQINGYWDPNPAVPPTFCVNTIWTEEFAPELYEVKFDCYRYEYNPNPEEKAGLYYTVEIGDSSPSPYCTQRDGYVNYGQNAIDYGNQKLKYKLPYLHPSYFYDLRAIVYQQGQSNWSQQFDIDSAFSTTVAFEPNHPETIWIRLPQELYKNDTKVKHEIKKILGNRAVIADLRIYQKEEFITSGGGGGPQSASNVFIQRPILYQSYPNPAKARTVIRYSLPVSGIVSLTIYDISGRVVRNLIDENKQSGIYSISWDGRDDKGVTLSQGVYFCRLMTSGFSDTKRLVLVR